MLGKADATPMIAVKDVDRAKKFYCGHAWVRQLRTRWPAKSSP